MDRAGQEPDAEVAEAIRADRTLSPGMQTIGHAEVLAIALPITLSNATVPLIGFIDTAVVGQLGAPHLMGAVAIAAIIFNMLYWTFSFLRMGTTGLTAQALGAADTTEQRAVLARDRRHPRKHLRKRCGRRARARELPIRLAERSHVRAIGVAHALRLLLALAHVRRLRLHACYANQRPSFVPYSMRMNFCIPSSALRVYG